jgi:glycosyltransferase involved in cell wall biosynthesis
MPVWGAFVDGRVLFGTARKAQKAQNLVERPDVVVAGRETFAWDVPDVAREHGLPCAVILQGTTTAGILRGTYPRAGALIEQYRKADLVVAPAEHVARALGPARLPNVRVIPNSVDAGRFRPRPRPDALLRALGVPAEHVVVAHASNLERVKRPLDLVDAAARVLAEEGGITFLVMGDGGRRAEMERACAAAGIADRFRFTGWVPHAAMPEHLAAAEVVAMTSEFEAQSLAQLEAMASGRVLVASDVDGAREIVADDETGLLFPAGDPDALAAAIVRAARDPGLRARIGEAARATALRHAPERQVAAYAQALAAVARR